MGELAFSFLPPSLLPSHSPFTLSSLLSPFPFSSLLPSLLLPPFLPPASLSTAPLGSRDNPMHMISHPRKGGFMREMWYLARFILIAFLITTFFSSAMVTQMKTGSKLLMIIEVIKVINGY